MDDRSITSELEQIDQVATEVDPLLALDRFGETCNEKQPLTSKS